MNKKIFLIFLLPLFFFGSFFLSYGEENSKDIQEKIKNQDKEIKRLEKAIIESEKKVQQYSGESISLQKEIANLNYLNSRLKKIIYEKEKDILGITANISSLVKKMENHTDEIKDLRFRLKNNIFTINQISQTPLFESILAGNQISDTTDDIVRIETLQKVFQQNIAKVTQVFNTLNEEKQEEEKENKKLDKEKKELDDKKFLLEKNKKDKDYLLNITKNKEENFKKLLDQQKKDKEEFEKELFELESKLKFILDKNSVPKKQIGLFAWPTPKKSDRISQFFGYTDFHSHYATQKRHNGVDIAVPTETEIFSVMSGEVLDTGDATTQCRRKQYGKWVAIDHGNGLTSMYAHLSRISVTAGQKVARGQKIGLAGNTGYSFGPHLHFTVYYTAGLNIKTITKNQPGCYVSPQKYKLPLASINAYANPFNYLPKPNFSRLNPVKFGDNNNYVRELQNMLTYEDIFPTSLDIDGDFGPLTEKYLQIWKDKNNISGNGKSFSQSDIKKFKKSF